MLVFVGQRLRAAREEWDRNGRWPGALAVVFTALLLALWLGVALAGVGVVVAILTGGGHVSLVIIGAGVLLIFVGLVARGYWP
jgi:hypothetical protein